MATQTLFVRAELLSIGTELLVGETRDTNSGDLSRELTSMGVEVVRATVLPDRLDAVTTAIRGALESVDLVVCTGGLGPTPDDLTREAVAAACGLEPFIDPGLDAWLRGLFERRGLAFAEANSKQAWLIADATTLPNPNGTAPGWWVDRPDGRVIVTLPGPPREMLPMWRDHVRPRVLERGVGRRRVSETLRLTGIGESALVGLIGDSVLRRANPEIATYARADAVDVRISAAAGADEPGRAEALLEAALAEIEPKLAPYLFARGTDGWPEALAGRLAGRSVSMVEIGTGGSLAALIGTAPWLAFGELVAPGSPIAGAHRGAEAYAQTVRRIAGTDIGLAVRVRERGRDTAVTVAVALERGVRQVTRTAFLGGDAGRRRAALIACAELWQRLGEPEADR
jgi:molybdenum cofactor synthesis domain-containing protein